MGRYVARRLLQMIPVFIGTTLLIFLMVYSPARRPRRGRSSATRAPTPRPLAAMRHEFGLDQPLWQQYWNYMTGHRSCT